jgi:hypothetical protein
MVVRRHETVGDDVENRKEVPVHLSEEEEVVFLLKEDAPAVIASVVEVIVLAWLKWMLSSRHRRRGRTKQKIVALSNVGTCGKTSEVSEGGS